jgi:hypothetical protein
MNRITCSTCGNKVWNSRSNVFYTCENFVCARCCRKERE